MYDLQCLSYHWMRQNSMIASFTNPLFLEMKYYLPVHVNIQLICPLGFHF